MSDSAIILKLEQRIRELEAEVEKTRKEAEIANHGKTMFLANMSHEIRTPMNSIIGIYNLLSQTNLTREQTELLDIIHISSHNLLNIINDILDLAKLEAGQLRIENQPFSLQEQLYHICKMLSIKAKGKGIELNTRIESIVPKCIFGDAHRLNQILINLTNNAIKFTLEGSVTISVETIPATFESFQKNRELIPQNLLSPQDIEKDHVLLHFRIIDTGVGISSNEQTLLFKEFKQLRNPMLVKHEGTGLGLSISRHLTQLMNGRIGVRSTVDVGSEFWFTLCLRQGNEECLKKEVETTIKPTVDRSLKILIVEDNLLNQKFAVTTLERAGHEVFIAENGRTAVEMYKKTHYDIILMDIAMPIMDGLEATRMIRRFEEDLKKEQNITRRIKILAVTAHVMVSDREKCLAAGMDHYLAKPYRPNDLINIINALEFD